MTDVAAPASASAANEASKPAFSPIVVLWMVLAGVFSFSAFIVLSAYAPDMRGGSDLGAHALSRSAVGYAGMVRLLRAEDDDVVISRAYKLAVTPAPVPSRAANDAPNSAPPSSDAPNSDAPNSDAPNTNAPNTNASDSDAGDGEPASSLVVLTPPEDAKKDKLLDLAGDGPTLVVAPKWLVAPDPLNPAYVTQAGLIDPKPIQTMLEPLANAVTVDRRTDTSAAQLNGPKGLALTGPIEQLQTLQISKALIPIVTDQRGGVVLAATPDHKIYFLSDPDLLANHGIADIATARAGNDLIQSLRKGDGPIAFDVTLNGFGSAPSVLKLAFSPPYLGATLCLVAAGLLIGLHAAARFGAPARVGRALAFGKRALADNSAALIRVAGREPNMAGRYLDLNRNAVIKALGAGRVPSGEVDAFLDRLAEKSGVPGRLSDLVPRTRAVKTRVDLTEVARDLYQWRLEMTRERH